MANTYTQIHLQFIFAVKYRKALILPSYKEELYKYITGIIQHYDHKVLAINGVENHIHIFIGMRPTQSVSDLLQDIKGSTSKWINEKKFLNTKFEWQSGYGLFRILNHMFKVLLIILLIKKNIIKKNLLEKSI